MTGLGALGLLLSAYLGWHYIAGGTVIGCGGGSPCDQVLGSRWSAIGGVLPVSGLAMGVYLAVLVASFFIGPGTEAPVRLLAWRALLVLGGAAGGSAVWFTIVQKWYIGAFCPYCMTTHGIGLLLATVVFWQAPRQLVAEATTVAPALPKDPAGVAVAAPALVGASIPARNPVWPWPVFGLAMTVVLALCQTMIVPPTVYLGGESQVRPVTALDPRAVPLVGSPTAPYLVSLLFDYNCPHCQRLHGMLEEVVGRYGGKVAFALCPAPLNPRCNPFIPQEVDTFKDSCELARIAMAVWVADREAFSAFDTWMYAPEPGRLWHPRSPDAALAKAIEMVGPTKFAAARGSAWIDRHLQTSVGIYGAAGGNAVPKLVFGSRWVSPEPADGDALVSILQSSLALPKP